MSSENTKAFVALALVLWFVTALVAGWFDVFIAPDSGLIGLGLFLVVPILFFITWYIVSARFRAFANSISLWLIVGAHVWRFVGLGFLVAYFLGRLPAQFAIPEGLGDIVAAAFALPIALALRRNQPVKGYFVLWNIFGLLDLLSAITVGILYSEGPFGILREGLSTAPMVTFPVNVIPTFFVPLFILLHVLALLRRNEVGKTVTAPRDLQSHRGRDVS